MKKVEFQYRTTLVVRMVDEKIARSMVQSGEGHIVVPEPVYAPVVVAPPPPKPAPLTWHQQGEALKDSHTQSATRVWQMRRGIAP